MSPSEISSTSDDSKNISDMSRTQAVTYRLGKSPAYSAPDENSEHGYYEGRRIIGEDTSIHGGVYLGGSEREAIVVDEKYGELGKVYDKMVEKIKDLKDTEDILVQCLAIVREVMPFSEEAVEKLKIKYDLGNDKKIALDSYLTHMGGGGVCRHQALLAGYLVEKLIKEGLEGKVSVDRSAIKGKGVHAWVRYENASGDIYIIDPTQGYVGTEKDSEGRYWNYKRPD